MRIKLSIIAWYLLKSIVITGLAAAAEVYLFLALGWASSNLAVGTVLVTFFMFYPLWQSMLSRHVRPREDRIIENLVQEFSQPPEQESSVLPDTAVPEHPAHPPVPHILLYGHGGMGKTTLARLYVKEIEKQYGHEIEFISTVSSQFREKEDIDKMMFRIIKNPFAVLFIDEIHGLPIEIEEALYSAMQDFYYDYSNDDRDTEQIHLPPFTLMGATTLMGQLSTPFQDRFTIKLEMERPDSEAMLGVVDAFLDGGGPRTIKEYAGQHSAKQRLFDSLKAVAFNGEIVITPEARQNIADRAMFVPRIAVQNSRSIVEYAKSKNIPQVTVEVVDEYFKFYGIDVNGLSTAHRRILKALLIQDAAIGRPSLAQAADVGIADLRTKYIPELANMGYTGFDNRGWVTAREKALNEYGYLIKGEPDAVMA